MQKTTSCISEAQAVPDLPPDLELVACNKAEIELLEFLQQFDASEMQYLMLKVIRLARAYQMEVLQEAPDLDAVVMVHLLSTKIGNTEADNWTNTFS